MSPHLASNFRKHRLNIVRPHVNTILQVTNQCRKFLLWHIQDYVTYAAPGQQHVLDMQALMSHPALNLRSIMLLSFRASHAGEQHADDLLEDTPDLGALPLGPAGPHLEAFVSWLEAHGYPPRRIFHLLRGAHRFSGWAHQRWIPAAEARYSRPRGVWAALQGLQRLRYPSGRLSHLFVGARHFVHFLRTTGMVHQQPRASSTR